MKKRNKIPARIKLTDCTACKQPFVNPDMEESHEVGPDHWHIVLRCGACGDVREGLFTSAEVNHFEDDLDVYVKACDAELARMTAENMEGEVSRFARALELDLIDADSFRL